jgi:hypothetical protein
MARQVTQKSSTKNRQEREAGWNWKALADAKGETMAG